jgi:hypothetical protein
VKSYCGQNAVIFGSERGRPLRRFEGDSDLHNPENSCLIGPVELFNNAQRLFAIFDV